MISKPGKPQTESYRPLLLLRISLKLYKKVLQVAIKQTVEQETQFLNINLVLVKAFEEKIFIPPYSWMCRNHSTKTVMYKHTALCLYHIFLFLELNMRTGILNQGKYKQQYKNEADVPDIPEVSETILARFADNTAILSVARFENEAKHELQNVLTSARMDRKILH